MGLGFRVKGCRSLGIALGLRFGVKESGSRGGWDTHNLRLVAILRNYEFTSPPQLCVQLGVDYKYVYLMSIPPLWARIFGVYDAPSLQKRTFSRLRRSFAHSS